MAPAILLVDDEHDVLRLLHSVLDTLQRPELEIIEAGSAEGAIQEIARRHVDLMVVDYRLPDMSGIELMHELRAVQPQIKSILITGTSDRKAREEMLNAGAAAVFDKPVPLADFLDAVEKALDFDRTIFPSEQEQTTTARSGRFSDLLANLRQDLGASAVFLINDRGLVAARAGDLRDSSMEVSLISALAATLNAGMKVAKSNRQETLDQFSVFAGGDHDLILMPVDPSYSLLLAGNDLAGHGGLFETIQAMLTVRPEVARALRSIGATGELNPSVLGRRRRGKTGELTSAAPEMEALLKTADEQTVKPEELDAFWDRAAAQHANQPTSGDVIPYEEARKRGLTPDSEK